MFQDGAKLAIKWIVFTAAHNNKKYGLQKEYPYPIYCSAIPRDDTYRVTTSRNAHGHSTWSNSKHQILLSEVSRNCLYQQFLSIQERTQCPWILFLLNYYFACIFSLICKDSECITLKTEVISCIEHKQWQHNSASVPFRTCYTIHVFSHIWSLSSMDPKLTGGSRRNCLGTRGLWRVCWNSYSCWIWWY